MHFWGLTIDVISCINLVIAVGLCVDYSAHIAHCYVISKGALNESNSGSIQNTCMYKKYNYKLDQRSAERTTHLHNIFFSPLNIFFSQ